MPAKRAKEYYIGRGKEGKFNCAQAILKAFQAHFSLDDALIRQFSAHGGGNSPGGVCGAYFAARHLLEKHHPEKLQEFDDFFLAQAGSLKCGDIRSGKKLSCLGCIEKSADFIAKL